MDEYDVDREFSEKVASDAAQHVHDEGRCCECLGEHCCCDCPQFVIEAEAR
jgi:hypothetical protein